MRHGRAKAARKTLQYFKRTIGLKPPYSILLDATFVATLFQQKILPVKSRLDRILQTNTTSPPGSSNGKAGPASFSVNKYFITQAAVDELKQIQRGLETKKHIKADTFREALGWIKKECIVIKSKEEANAKKEGVEKEFSNKPANKQETPAQEELLRQMEESEVPYIVASQDDELLGRLRQKGTVPIVRLANHTVLLLEQPSKQSQVQAKGVERKKWKHNLPQAERTLVELVREQDREKADNGNSEITTMNQPPRQKIKKAKGPNPLSCKRKQRSGDEKQQKESTSKKRRRRAQKKQDDGEAVN